MRWQSITKILVVSSALGAEIAHALLATNTPLLGLGFSSGAFICTLFIARRFPLHAMAAVMLGLYILPAVYFLLFHHFAFFHSLPVSACLLAIFLARPSLRQWQLPQQWQLPLVFWAVLIALSWPIIFMRELDFTFALPPSAPLLTGATVSNFSAIPPHIAALWIAHAALRHSIGILLLDWLFCTFQTKHRTDFMQWVLLPLAIGVFVNIFVAFYQSFIDNGFLTASWMDISRASGTVIDANALGVLAALWGPALVVLFMRRQASNSVPLALFTLAGSWLCMLLSGSTSALWIAGPTAGVLLWFGGKALFSTLSPNRILLSLISLGFACGLVWISFASPMNRSLSRLWGNLPLSSEASLSTVLESQLRDRPFFARIAIQIATERSFAGIGVGRFHTLGHKYALQMVASDPRAASAGEIYNCGVNCCAHNWYLEQVAELGLLGILAWVLWIIVFIRTVLLVSPEGSLSLSVSLLKSILVGFGLASVFNIPAENLAILLTFWIFIFWLSSYFPHLAVPREKIPTG